MRLKKNRAAKILYPLPGFLMVRPLLLPNLTFASCVIKKFIFMYAQVKKTFLTDLCIR
jgi:hypothetical protein